MRKTHCNAAQRSTTAGSNLFGVANKVHIRLKPTSTCGIVVVLGGGGGHTNWLWAIYETVYCHTRHCIFRTDANQVGGCLQSMILSAERVSALMLSSTLRKFDFFQTFWTMRSSSVTVTLSLQWFYRHTSHRHSSHSMTRTEANKLVNNFWESSKKRVVGRKEHTCTRSVLRIVKIGLIVLILWSTNVPARSTRIIEQIVTAALWYFLLASCSKARGLSFEQCGAFWNFRGAISLCRKLKEDLEDFAKKKKKKRMAHRLTKLHLHEPWRLFFFFLVIHQDRWKGKILQICFFALPHGSVKNDMAHVALRGRGTFSVYNCFPAAGMFSVQRSLLVSKRLGQNHTSAAQELCVWRHSRQWG